MEVTDATPASLTNPEVSDKYFPDTFCFFSCTVPLEIGKDLVNSTIASAWFLLFDSTYMYSSKGSGVYN